jgi:hypothetical protein
MPIEEELPEDAIIIEGESKVFTEPSEPETNTKSLKHLHGILEDHRESYSSVELQHKSSKRRKDVSD